MNKMLTVSLVAVLGVVGGGAYVYMNPEKNFSQYIPEPVTNLLGDYIPGFSESDTSTGSTIVIEEYVEEEKPLMEPQVEAEPVQPLAEPLEMQQVAEEQLQSQSDDNVVSEVMDDIQKSINEVSVDEVVENKKANNDNPQVISLEQEIDQVSNEIVKLDFENNQLEEKFQIILRKNRDLAKQLKEIDEKLATAN